MNELHQHWLQVTEGGSGLHAETQLLLEVTTKGNLKYIKCLSHTVPISNTLLP